MDHFGIGAGVHGAVRTYFQSARRTGRTTSLVESLHSGDRVVFADQREAERVRALCKEPGLDVECIVIDPVRLHTLQELGSAKRRLIFDHIWLEQYYQRTLDACTRLVDELQRECGGYGTPHYETRRQAEELARWRNT
jgi:hypothetical protein